MPAGIHSDIFQKAKAGSPGTGPWQQQLYSVALVTWATWPGHFGGDSLVLPFGFQSNSQNQIPKLKRYLQWAYSHCSWPLLHQKLDSR